MKGFRACFAHRGSKTTVLDASRECQTWHTDMFRARNNFHELATVLHKVVRKCIGKHAFISTFLLLWATSMRAVKLLCGQRCSSETCFACSRTFMSRTRVAQSSKKVLIKACFYPYFLTTLSNKYEGPETFVWAKMFVRNMFRVFKNFHVSHKSCSK